MGISKPKYETQEKEKLEKKQKEEKARTEARKRKAIEGVRGIVRIAEMDMDGTKKVAQALIRIKGIGHSLAKAVTIASGISSNVMVGSLTDEQLDKLEDIMRNPIKYGIPSHMVNRRSDPVVGGDRHLISSELAITKKADIDFMKKIRSYKGIRHELGLPVRGQRTRSSFRTGAKVGVAKGAARAAMRPAPKAGGPAPVAAAPGTKAPEKVAETKAAPAKTEEKKK